MKKEIISISIVLLVVAVSMGCATIVSVPIACACESGHGFECTEYLGHPYLIETETYEPGYEKYGQEYLIDVPKEWKFYSNIAATKGEGNSEGFCYPPVRNIVYWLEIVRLDRLAEHGVVKSNLTPFEYELGGVSVTNEVFNPIVLNINGKAAVCYEVVEGYRYYSDPNWMACLFAWNQTVLYRLTFYNDQTQRLNETEKAFARGIFQSFREPDSGDESQPTPEVIPSPTPTPTPNGPGFETVFAIAGLSAVAYLLRRKKTK